jgi:hypothetical protein
LSRKTKNGKRTLHGKHGEGRLRAFALGSDVSWVSESENTTGAIQTVTLQGSRDRGRIFRWDTAPSTAKTPGTIFTARNHQDRNLNALDRETTPDTLRTTFAPVLLNEAALSITFDGTPIDPRDEILRDTKLSGKFDDDPSQTLQVRIIEWRGSGSHRTLYFGPDEIHFPYETSGRELEGQFPYSAYVTWGGFDGDTLSMLGLGEMANGPSGSIWRFTRESVRAHFAARRLERRREQIQQWREDKVYPYTDEPASEPEKVERAVFDVIASALVPKIPKRNGDAKLTLTLLRDAVRADPDNLAVILHEVVALSEADRVALTKLLNETTLSSIIRSANLVASRHKFLAGLERLLFDPNDSSVINERNHLHKILERELWIFGEAYHLMSSERGLTEMLRTHLRLEGLSTKGIEPIRRWDGRSGRTDLHLAAKYKEHDRIRHLVVELKAPDITARRAERDQLEDYVNVVLANSAFATEKSSWDFILIVTDYDDLVSNSIIGGDQSLGLVFDPGSKPGRPTVRGFVRRWRDVLDENRRRLEFITSALEHDPSLSEGLAFLREQYSELLPVGIAEEAQIEQP